jgi:hypothetical protein
MKNLDYELIRKALWKKRVEISTNEEFISNRGMARRIGVDHVSYGYFIKGKTEPHPGTMQKIFAFLGKTESDYLKND